MTVKLGDICSFQSGGTPSKTNADYFFGDIPWITTVALNGQVIGKTAAVDWITGKAIEESAAKIVPARSIMVGTRVGVGKVAINEIPMSTSQDIISLVGINESLWNKEFLCKFIQSKETYLKSQARGATIKGIKIDVLASLDIPDVPFDSQKEIVAAFDKVQNILAARRSQLSALDDLIKVRFIEMFGDQESNPFHYKVGTLKDVSDIFLGLTHTPTYVDKGRPFISVRDISSGSIDFSNCHYITEEEFQSLPNGAKPKANDLLFCRVGTIGKPVIVPEETPEFGSFVSVGFLRRKSNVFNEYLKAWMDNPFFMKQVYDNVAGASQINLNTGWLKNFRILIPPLEKQNQFATFVKQVDKSKSVIQKSLDETRLLFDSLMQKYFG